MLRALALGAMQDLKLLFLFAKFLNDSLHRRSHESSGIVASGFRVAGIAFVLRAATQESSRRYHPGEGAHNPDDEKKRREQPDWPVIGWRKRS